MITQKKAFTLLAIESSCDETGCAVVKKHPDQDVVKILAEQTATSLFKHKATKGIVPEVAAREQLKAIMPVLQRTLAQANLPPLTSQNATKYLDTIAVTVGPGLVGSLLVGIETARALGYAWNLPVIGVDHIQAHPYANFIQSSTTSSPPQFPLLTWVISGGHTQLSYMESHDSMILLGGSVDDAAGECFDKCARLLGFDYPGGPALDTLAKTRAQELLLSKDAMASQVKKLIPNLPRPLISSGDFRMSFSGLKTAFLRTYATVAQTSASSLAQFSHQDHEVPHQTHPNFVGDLALELQQAVSEIIVQKTRLALQLYPNTRTVMFSGGVSANSFIRKHVLSLKLEYKLLDIYFPPLSYCTDNAAMIGAFAAFHPNEKRTWKEIELRLHTNEHSETCTDNQARCFFNIEKIIRQ